MEEMTIIKYAQIAETISQKYPYKLMYRGITQYPHKHWFSVDQKQSSEILFSIGGENLTIENIESVMLRNIKEFGGITPNKEDFGLNLGRNIKSERVRKGLTLKKLAKRAGTTKNYLWKIENTENCPSIFLVRNIANALNANINSLICEW